MGAYERPGATAATLTRVVSRTSNPHAPGVCEASDTTSPFKVTEPHVGGITELRLTFDVAPGGQAFDPVTLEVATCAAPGYVFYSGDSFMSASVAGNDLVLTFTPGLENAQTYKVTVNLEVSTIGGQFVEVRGLLGDVNGSGFVNATDRSVVVGAWTAPGSYSCPTDLNNDGDTNATDRSSDRTRDGRRHVEQSRPRSAFSRCAFSPFRRLGDASAQSHPRFRVACARGWREHEVVRVLCMATRCA